MKTGPAVLALVVVLVVAAGVSAIVLVSRAMTSLYGPTAGTRLPDGRLVIASHGQLHVFDDGRRVERVALSALGLGAIAGDLDVLSGGELLVGDTGSRRLMRCRLAERSCRVFFEGGIRGAFKAEVAPASGHVVVTDSSNHRMLLLDANGRLLAATATNGPRFNFPNGLAFGAEGLIAVADTDHRRLAMMRLEGDMMRPEARDIDLGPLLKPLEVLFPLDVRPDPRGRWWVVVASNSLRQGSVVVLEADGTLARQVPLGADSDPLAFVSLPEAMLVLQPGIPAVTRISLDGVAQAFGDAAFQQELVAERERVQRLGYLRYGVQALLILACLAALVVAVRAGGGAGMLAQLQRRWNIPQQPLPLPAEQTWIEANPRPLRAATLAILIGTAFLLVLLWLYLPGALKLDAAHEQALWKASLFLLALPFFVLLFLHRPRARLGIDAGSVLLVDGAGRWSSPLEEVRYSSTQLLVGHRRLRLRMPGADLFPLDQVAGLILARLPREAFLSEWQLFFLARKRALARWRRPRE